MTARLGIRVQPGARRPGLKGWLADGTLKLAVAAAPEGGRANAAVVELLAGALGLHARDVKVVRGMSGRAKVIEVNGLAEGALRSRLAAVLEASRADHGE